MSTPGSARGARVVFAFALAVTVIVIVQGGCSGGGPPGPAGPPGPPGPGTDGGGGRDGAVADLLAGGCVTAFSCQAATAEHGCGVTTDTGQRYPDRGAPYCTNKLVREKCSCDLIRCASPGPLCPGTYHATFRERLLQGCDGIAGQLSGTCKALWNVVELSPGGDVLSDRGLLNVDLDWGFADYTQTFTLTGQAPVRLVVQQYCWLQDVQGVGDAGRAEVSQASLSQ